MKRPAEMSRSDRQQVHPYYEQEPEQSGLPPRIKIRLASVPELTIFQIREDELEALQRGAPDSIYQTCAFSLFGIGTSFLISLLTAQPSHQSSVAFVALTAVTYGASIPLFVVWLKRRKSTAELVKKIESRLRS